VVDGGEIRGLSGREEAVPRRERASFQPQPARR
jgi:hypothetical protein